MRLRRPLVVGVTVCVGCGGCGGQQSGRPEAERLTPSEARRLPKDGQLGYLCPAPDVSDDLRERNSREAKAQARALIAEVRRRPAAIVTLGSQDAHTGAPFTETLTVRELALQHLENPGVEGVPCERKLMTELQAAVEGRPVPAGVENERTYTQREVVAGLRLVLRRGIYRSPGGCEVYDMFFDRREVELALAEPMQNLLVITSPKRRVGVRVFAPDRRCRESIARSLERLDR
jgi:hypothetical protein